MSVASEIARLQNAKASIKTSIENKGVTVGDIKLDAYSAKIDAISTGAEPTGTLEINENGTYDVKQKAYAKVAVPEPSGNIKITENGFHIIKQYSIAEVAVYPTLIAKTISANGTYNASDDNAYGYGSVSVNVPEKQLGTKTITANGVYNATDDNVDGYSQVTVETSGVDINEYFSNTIESGNDYIQGWTKTVKKLMSPLHIQGTDGSNMFNTFSGSELPEIDTSNITNMRRMFYDCPNLISLPQLNTGNVTNMYEAFRNCFKLSSLPEMNTNNVTNMDTTFSGCRALTTLPQLNTGNVTNMSNLFNDCNNLLSIPLLNTENVTNISYMFNRCYKLTTLGGLENLGKAYNTSVSANNSYYCLKLSYSNSLTHDSLMNVINNLYDIASAGIQPQQLILGSTNLAKLTAEEIAIATNKGWTVS